MRDKTIRLMFSALMLTVAYIAELYFIGLDGAMFGTYIGALIIIGTGKSIYEYGKIKGGNKNE